MNGGGVSRSIKFGSIGYLNNDDGMRGRSVISDVNEWLLLMLGWTDTNLRAALFVVRDCLVLEGGGPGLRLEHGCSICSA